MLKNNNSVTHHEVSKTNINWWFLLYIVTTIVIVYIAWKNPPPLYRIYRLLDPAIGMVPFPSASNPNPFVLNPYEMVRPQLSVFDLFYLFLYYLATMVLGNVMFNESFRYWGPSNIIPRMIMAFSAGYISIVGFNRIASLVIDCRKLYIATFVLIISYVIVTLYLSKKDNITNNSTGLSYTSLSIFSCILFISTLLMQVYQYDFTWHGHFGMYLSETQDQIRKMNLDVFPISFSYYDSALFHYVMTYPIADKIHVILPWWLTLSFVKLSLFTLIFSVLYKLTSSNTMSFVSTSYLFWGTTSPVITNYYLLFDYGNPIFQEVDISRIVSFSIFILIVLLIAKSDNKISPFAVFLFSIGVTSLVTSHVTWIIFAWFAVWLFAGDSDITKSISTKTDRLICFSSVTAWSLLFILPFNDYYIVRLLACVLPIIAWVFRYIINSSYFTICFNRDKLLSIIAIISITFGLMFLGNIFIDNKIANFMYSNFTGKFILIGKQWSNLVYKGNFSLGDFRDIGTMMVHSQFNSGIVGFYSFYGIVLIMILFGQYFTYHSWKSAGPERVAKILFEFFLISVISLPILFFFMDFVNICDFSWYKIRFTQIPILYIQFYFFYILSRCKFMHYKTINFLVILMIIFSCIIPFVATERPAQLLKNLKVVQYIFLK